MDMNFPGFCKASLVGNMPLSFAVLMAGIATRRASGPTVLPHAPAQAPTLLAPAHGAFNRAVASLLAADNSG